MANTIPLNGRASGATRKMDDFEADRIPLLEDLVFDGNNGQYRVFCNQIISKGGEAQVYHAMRLSDGLQCVAKIYDKYQDTPLNRMNRAQTIQFLLEHSNYKECHFLPLFDYGMVTIPDITGEDYRKPIDIIPLCEGGELKKADYTSLKDEIIPAVLHAMNLMHKAGLVHRDIKPGNIYRYNGIIVLADFGTTSRIGEERFTGTRLRRGTPGYTAPEVWQGYVQPESDYFSLGCTIASLYRGEHVYQRLIDLNDEGGINRAINTNGLPLSCGAKEEPLQALVDALSCLDIRRRITYDGVVSWLNNPTKFSSSFSRTVTREDNDLHTGFHFDGKTLFERSEIAAALASNWERAKTYMYQNGSKNSALVGYFSQNDQDLSVKIGQIIEARETAMNFDLGLAQALHYIDLNSPIYWMGKTYKSLSSIAAAIDVDQHAVPAIEKMLASGFVSWKLQHQSTNSNDSTIRTIEEISRTEQLAKSYPRLAVLLAKHQFSAKQPDYHGITSVDELFKNVAKADIPGDSQTQVAGLIHDDEALAFIAAMGYRDSVISFKRAITQSKKDNVELLYRLLESVCKDKRMIRDHYIKLGPLSYVAWIQSNIQLYSFNTRKAQELGGKIMSVRLLSEETLTMIHSKMVLLSEYVNDLRKLFQGNIILAFLGVDNDANSHEITSKESDAFFVEEFLGTDVPAGYRRYLQSKYGQLKGGNTK